MASNGCSDLMEFFYAVSYANACCVMQPYLAKLFNRYENSSNCTQGALKLPLQVFAAQ